MPPRYRRRIRRPSTRFRNGTTNRRRYRRRPRFPRRALNRYSLNEHRYVRTQGLTQEMASLGHSFQVYEGSTATTRITPLVNTDVGYLNLMGTGGAGRLGEIAYCGFSWSPQLRDIYNYSSEFGNLYDQYKILGVRMKITCVNNVSTNDDSGNGWGSTNYYIHSVFDADDSNMPTINQVGISTLQQYPSYKVRRLVSNKPIKYYLRPRVNVVANNIELNKSSRSNWLDINDSPNTSHYGFKFIITSPITNDEPVNTILRIDFKYYLAFKGVR